MSSYYGKVEKGLFHCKIGVCEGCPYQRVKFKWDCKQSLIEDAGREISSLDRSLETQRRIIIEQKAKIEKFEIVKKHIDTAIHRNCDYSTTEGYNKAFQKYLARLYDNTNTNAKARKEFAERLTGIFGFDEMNGVVIKSHVINLLEEIDNEEKKKGE